MTTLQSKLTIPTLETERLILRPPRLADAETIFNAYAQDPEVTRYLMWTPHESVEETKRFVKDRCLELPEDGSRLIWAITERDNDKLCGMIELRPRGHKADVGYVLARSFWGRNYMTEALRAVLELAFTLPGMYRVWALCDVDNVGSARVMEKAGLTFEGVMRRHTIHPNISPEPRDMRCYAMTR